ncbi:UDP-N-acetylglucosamine 2-epimerase [Candidatus Nitrosocosmicus arcticus]|uniref:Putative UDP-N-acetylglucosamine 2-epimerase n=1 Tax=Candidatus Nitrosocosmicus arcticus TaxID=2035267 RepID=A0A557STB9_9ARCH|nr:UDP-N-acetylglucosamine 2-epimerase [Candidatus Nitrosocosmicus arcticus]TVP39849.1 putative UDP-N-acetylglucosamine 2-epimerase [Candidatus Nitrosocosmicus arcticus]
MGYDKQYSSKFIKTDQKNFDGKFDTLKIDKEFLPIRINKTNLDTIFSKGNDFNKALAIVIGTKPDFYKQAPLLIESIKEGLPSFIISTGQHYDELLGYGIKEFDLENSIVCDLQIRGDLMEKSSDLIMKFGYFGRYLKRRFSGNRILPIVHGDTLVAGIATLSWVFGLGQKVGQNEAGLRSMSPTSIKGIKMNVNPSRSVLEKFITDQLSSSWFLTREEPFPEQIDTWVCSSGTKFFFVPTKLNKEHLLREGYPEEDIHIVGNSVVDAIGIKRMSKPANSIFELYPKLESGNWIRMDIHRRENLTNHRFNAIIGGLTDLIKDSEFKIVLVLLNATISALNRFDLYHKLKDLEISYPDKFMMTELWKEYGHVVEFLDSGKCWAEITDSGSLQEELLYFPKVSSFTVRFNTDRPETVFEAKGNLLVPPINRMWLPKMITLTYEKGVDYGFNFKKKKKIYGKPGEVSKKIVKIMKKEFENRESNFFPWLHQRFNYWHEKDDFDYL